MTQNERVSENEINSIRMGFQEELRSSLERYVDGECAEVLSRLFLLIVHPSIISVILSKKDDYELERTPAIRTLMDEMRKEIEPTFGQTVLEFEREAGEKVVECLDKLLKTDYLATLAEEGADDMIEGCKEKVKKYEGAEGLLSLFDNALKKDLQKTMKVIGFYCTQKSEELYFKLFDSVRLVHQISDEELFEIKAVNLMCSTNLLIEAYYRKLVSLILDLMDILEGKEPTLKLKYVGEAYKKFKEEKYTVKYPEIEIFFKEWIKNIRNAIAHSDYNIEPTERKIMILDSTGDKTKPIEVIAENDFEARVKEMFQLSSIFLYASQYFLVSLSKPLLGIVAGIPKEGNWKKKELGN